MLKFMIGNGFSRHLSKSIQAKPKAIVMLPSIDQDYLDESYPGHTVSNELGTICVVVPDFQLPKGFKQSSANLLLRLETGYPDIKPDMWWFTPAIQRLDDRQIPRTETENVYFERKWQRWSRHLTDEQWKPGIDSIQSYMTVIRQDLKSAAEGVA